LIDDGLALWFPGPASFTGEDVAELQLHGSLAVERALTDEVLARGAVVAEAGGFTWRAFENGKLDLTQVEGLSDLLEAETSLQHQQAMDGYRGRLREKAEEWRAQLISAMAQLDAAVDFPDEEDVPEAIEQRASPIVRQLRSSISTIVESGEGARKVAEGVTIALIGEPNVGKSSLFNALLDDQRAIVSDIAGTTRDVITAVIELEGVRTTLADLAGIRGATDDQVEEEGVRRAKAYARTADLRLFCVAHGAEAQAWFDRYRQEQDISIVTKDDRDIAGGVSVHRSQSIAELRQELSQRVRGIATPGLAPSDRQQYLLQQALIVLSQFEEAASVAPEMGGEVLRHAALQLEHLTGRVTTEEVLGDIFSSFCIGK
jgi:tRNA modification GTPase